MAKKGIDDFNVVFSDQAQSMMVDPECSEAIRDALAQLRQALSDVDPDDPEAVAAVMWNLGAVPVDPDDFPEDDDGHD